MKRTMSDPNLLRLADLPDESLFSFLGTGDLAVRLGKRIYMVKQTSPMSYAPTGASGPVTSAIVRFMGRIPGFRPKAKKPKAKKASSSVSGSPCSCGSLDGVQEDADAVAKQVRVLTRELAKVRRELEEGPKPRTRKARKAAPLVPQYDDDGVPF